MSAGRSAAIAVWLCAVGCATQFTPVPDSGAGTGAGNGSGDMSASGSGSAGPGSSGGGGGGSGSSSGSTGTSGGGGDSSGTGSGAGGTGSGVAGSGNASGDGGATNVPTCPATSTLQPGDTNATISVGGTTRQYIVHVPTSYTGKTPVPLVTDWHPILLDYNYERQYSGYASKADQEGFIVVFPNGINNAWNVGPCCTTSRNVDDVGFGKALIAKIEGQACIDPKRVYAVGYSMGGGMAMKLACDAADIIAAVAPSAFDLMDPSNGWNCQPSRPITVISFRSTGDNVVPYAGGLTYPPNGLPITITFLGAVGTFKKWAQLDQCTGSPTDNSSLGTGCQTYTQCAQGVNVTLCTKQGGGHDTGDPNVGWSMIKRYALP
jgi:polyhydroxybutyrate depolymerase